MSFLKKENNKTNKNEEHCPNCHHHCHKSNLRCDRGKKHFKQANTALHVDEQKDKCIKAIASLKRKYDKSDKKNQVLDCLTDCEKNILLEIINKIEGFL